MGRGDYFRRELQAASSHDLSRCITTNVCLCLQSSLWRSQRRLCETSCRRQPPGLGTGLDWQHLAPQLQLRGALAPILSPKDVPCAEETSNSVSHDRSIGVGSVCRAEGRAQLASGQSLPILTPATKTAPLRLYRHPSTTHRHRQEMDTFAPLLVCSAV